MLIAVDVAILPPRDVSHRAIALSAALPAAESQGLLLSEEFIPHITLTQQFIPVAMLDAAMEQIDQVVRGSALLSLRVTGGGKGSNSVWMSIERTPAIVDLHAQLLRVTDQIDASNGDASAFVGGDARDRDVKWVSEFRRESSFGRFTPHITLGHATAPPLIEPFDFVATTIAVCHLGRFCSCRRIVREWDLRRV